MMRGGVQLLSTGTQQKAKKVETFLQAEVIAELKEEAKKKGTSLSGLIRMILLEYLEAK